MNMGLVNAHTMPTTVATGAYEYMLVVRPDADAYQRLQAEKDFFAARFRSVTAVASKPYISIASFMAYEAMEETMIRWMARVISAKQGFDVVLNQYGAFRSHSICLQVQDHRPFLQLAKELKVVDQYIQSYGCPGMQMVSSPHLAIARKLDAATYHEALTVYAGKTFEASFRVRDLVLLRRRDRFDTCRQVNVFGLRP